MVSITSLPFVVLASLLVGAFAAGVGYYTDAAVTGDIPVTVHGLGGDGTTLSVCGPDNGNTYSVAVIGSSPTVYECKTCSAGFWALAPGATGCESCPLGHTCVMDTSQNKAIITMCDKGSFPDESRSACVDSTAGFFYPEPHALVPCPVGFVCPAGSYVPQTCPAGEVVVDGSCQAMASLTSVVGGIAIASAGTFLCPAGTWPSADYTACEIVAEGTYRRVGAAPETCAAGTYSSMGASSCLDVPAGYAEPTDHRASLLQTCPSGQTSKHGVGQCYTPSSSMSTSTVALSGLSVILVIAVAFLLITIRARGKPTAAMTLGGPRQFVRLRPKKSDVGATGTDAEVRKVLSQCADDAGVDAGVVIGAVEGCADEAVNNWVYDVGPRTVARLAVAELHKRRGDLAGAERAAAFAASASEAAPVQTDADLLNELNNSTYASLASPLNYRGACFPMPQARAHLDQVLAYQDDGALQGAEDAGTVSMRVLFQRRLASSSKKARQALAATASSFSDNTLLSPSFRNLLDLPNSTSMPVEVILSSGTPMQLVLDGESTARAYHAATLKLFAVTKAALPRAQAATVVAVYRAMALSAFRASSTISKALVMEIRGAATSLGLAPPADADKFARALLTVFPQPLHDATLAACAKAARSALSAIDNNVDTDSLIAAAERLVFVISSVFVAAGPSGASPVPAVTPEDAEYPVTYEGELDVLPKFPNGRGSTPPSDRASAAVYSALQSEPEALLVAPGINWGSVEILPVAVAAQ